MAYMIAGYIIIWAATFGLVVSIVRRQATLQREIAALQEAIAQKQGKK